MNQPQPFVVTANMLNEVLRRGHTPIAFVMNQQTRDRMAQDAINEHRRKLSVIGRMWFWMRKRGTKPVLNSLHGIPVETATHLPNGFPLPDGALFLSSATPFQTMMGQQNQSAQNAPGAPMQEFQVRERVEASTQEGEEVRPTLDDLSKGTGDRPSVSDVLMKAIENAENLKAVVVVRVHANNDVDMCLNVDHFTAQGILQKAQYWLATRGE